MTEFDSGTVGTPADLGRRLARRWRHLCREEMSAGPGGGTGVAAGHSRLLPTVQVMARDELPRPPRAGVCAGRTRSPDVASGNWVKRDPFADGKGDIGRLEVLENV